MSFGSGVASGFGITGAAADLSSVGLSQRLAGETFGGHVALWVGDDNCFYVADPDNNVTIERIIGISTGAANMGTVAHARFTGELVDPSFNFALGPVYLGPNGALTQNLPTSGNLLLLGYAAGPTTLQVRIEFICKLS